MIDVFNEYHAKNPDSKLLLIGTGPLEEKIKAKVEKLNLSDYVLFLGQREDTNKLYSVMDVFCLPSLYEGLPVVGIEAQASGLPCVLSTKIDKGVKISEECIFKNINYDMIDFIKKLHFKKNRNIHECLSEIFNISKNIKTIEDFYAK